MKSINDIIELRDKYRDACSKINDIDNVLYKLRDKDLSILFRVNITKKSDIVYYLTDELRYRYPRAYNFLCDGLTKALIKLYERLRNEEKVNVDKTREEYKDLCDECHISFEEYCHDYIKMPETFYDDDD